MDGSSRRNFGLYVQRSPRFRAFAVSWMIVLALIIIAIPAVQAQTYTAQTYTVVHQFAGIDGRVVRTGLTVDAAGSLYGTTWAGGQPDRGTIFKLKHAGSGWVLTQLYAFPDFDSGFSPFGRVLLAHDGTLYGTTELGGLGSCYSGEGCGVVFQLRPPLTAPKSALAPWNETVLYRFTGGSDGGNPTGDLTFDGLGNIYGTAWSGGSAGYGVVYKLTPSGSGWTQTVLYSPQYLTDGQTPSGGVAFDTSGNLYGVFQAGGTYGRGAVYELRWRESHGGTDDRFSGQSLWHHRALWQRRGACQRL